MGRILDDLRGYRFGYLTVIALESLMPRPTRWLCRCDCGKKHVVTAGNLKSGATSSCGCFKRELQARASEDAQERRRLKAEAARKLRGLSEDKAVIEDRIRIAMAQS